MSQYTGTLKAKVETLSLKELENLLSEKEANRNLMESHVVWLAEQMKAGKWRVTGEPIIISDNGRLLDGQHRVAAAIHAGIPLVAMVVRGADPKDVLCIGCGIKRTTAHSLQMAGEKNGHLLASALSWMFLWDEAKMLWKAKAGGFTTERAVWALRRHPGLRESVAWAEQMRHSSPTIGRMPVSAVAFMHYIFLKYDVDVATRFWSQLNGDEVPQESVQMLKRWIVHNTPCGDTVMVIAITVKAFTNFVQGESKKLFWTRLGHNTESFPVFVGEKKTRGEAIRISRPDEIDKERTVKKGNGKRRKIEVGAAAS